MSAMTEEEAKTKWCHRSSTGTLGHRDSYCLGSVCMAWRWMPDEVEPITGHAFQVVTGYCGLAGRPE